MLAVLAAAVATRADGQAATSPVTRADLAAAYQRLDALLAASPPDSATMAEVSRGFDASTLQFFAGRGADAVRALQRLSARLLGDTTPDGPLARTVGLRVVPAPRVAIRGSGDASLRLEPVAPRDSASAIAVRVRLLDARDREVLSVEETLPAGNVTGVVLPVHPRVLSRLPVGRYRAFVRATGSPRELLAGTWDVAATSPDTVRERLAARAAAFGAGVAAAGASAAGAGAAVGAAQPQDVAAFRSRLANLTGAPSPDRSAQFLSDPASLARALEREADALAAGREPYAGGDGDLWRTVTGPGGVAMPVRVIVPPGSPRHLRPLVIALHGAGGDENMFPEAYGAGAIVRLALERGALLATPATTVFQRDPGFLDSLIAVVDRGHGVDQTRVYLVGHSMGAAAAWGAALARPARIAAVVTLAGAGRAPTAGQAVPPSLWIAGALDGVIPAARAAGASAEFRELPALGHTMMVGPALPAAFDFLFARQRAAP